MSEKNITSFTVGKKLALSSILMIALVAIVGITGFYGTYSFPPLCNS